MNPGDHKQRTEGRGARIGAVRCTLYLLLLAVVATTAVRIEILNRMAGGRLPNRERRDDGGIVKWRADLRIDEARWRTTLGPRDESGNPVTRPLTAAEVAQMTDDTRKARANNTLRDVVGTWGLAQYVFAPLAAVLGIQLLFGSGLGRAPRAMGGVGVIVASAACAVMVVREYFTSLGW